MKKASPIDLLKKLCAYYLDCLALEAAGVVVELKQKPVFLQLPSVEFLLGPGAPVDPPTGLAGFLEKAHGLVHPTVFLGYPVLVTPDPVKGTSVTPVLLWSLEAKPGAGLIRFSELPPVINQAALESLPGQDTGSAIDEALLLGDVLQLDAMTGGPSALDELGRTLKAARPGWPWVEPPNAAALETMPPLPGLLVPGLYNRAILAATSKKLYTLGLERELRDLACCTPKELEGTALEQLLSGVSKLGPHGKKSPFLQPAPLNDEQLEAVARALSQPIAPVTGPPGTGKSQVVAGLLVNAAYSGQSALFVSRNNKAVEVVESRVNDLTSTPFLLRLGQVEHNRAVADHLDKVLATPVDPADRAKLQAAKGKLSALYKAKAQANAADESLRARREAVRSLAEETEALRSLMTPAGFSASRTAYLQRLSDDRAVLSAALVEATRALQPWYRRALWPFLRRPRFDRLAAEGARFGDGRLPGMPPPDRAPDDLAIPVWKSWADRVGSRLGLIGKAKSYHGALDRLGEGESAEEVARAELARSEEIFQWSRQVWASWLRVLPDRLTEGDVDTIGRYAGALKAAIAAAEAQKSPGPHVIAAIRKTFPGVLKALPCWAVTSLSARGRFPFQPRIFDLLVLDEASQSDLASVLPLLFRARRFAVIGDPMQLKHISSITVQQDDSLCEKHGVGGDFQEWRYRVNSAWDRAASRVPPAGKTHLRDHHRSHSDIIEFSNRSFYEGKLRVMTRRANLKSPDGGPAVEWIDVKGNPVRPRTGGVVNEIEAQAVVKTLESLLVKGGYKGSVGVTSPFRMQAERIEALVEKVPALRALAANASLTVRTVHQFQGDERDVIVLSPGVNGDGPKGALTFLRRNAYLFNVAVTRARAKLIVVGDRAGAACCGVEYLQKFVAWVENVEKAANARPLDPATLGPTYPEDPALAPRYPVVKDLYEALFEAGLRPIPRFPIDSLTVDLALVDGERRLAIEVLGEGAHRPWVEEDVKDMRRRVRRLVELGWAVETVWPWEIRDRLREFVERIKERLCPAPHGGG